MGGACAFYSCLLAGSKTKGFNSRRLSNFVFLLVRQFILGLSGNVDWLDCILPLYGDFVAAAGAMCAVLQDKKDTVIFGGADIGRWGGTAPGVVSGRVFLEISGA